MDSDEVIFVQEKRRYRKRKACTAPAATPKKVKKQSAKMEAAAKTTRKYIKKSLPKKESQVVRDTAAAAKKSDAPLLLSNLTKKVMPQPIHIHNNFTFPAAVMPPPPTMVNNCHNYCVHQQMLNMHHHHPPAPNFYPGPRYHPFRSQMRKSCMTIPPYPGMQQPFPTFARVFEEDADFSKELDKLLFSCGSWSNGSAADLWQPEGRLQRLLSEHGLDEVSSFNTATPSLKQIFGRFCD